ncbi:hypothetical protein Q8A73_007626 [Channa argus]|nr:hypothetical protein Q8A73_007626 [Channa argus]
MMRKRDTLQSRGEKGAREQDKKCKVCPVGETDCLKLQIRMKVFIWVTLLVSMRSSNADTEASLGRPSCINNFCISLIEGKITAEAGLCVVIPCSFSTDPGFTSRSIVWFRCEPSKPKCTESNMIFHTNKNNQKVQSEFRERVSLLESKISQKNCSIIINDLKESDSGSYQLRVNGLLSGKLDGFTFIPRATVSVKGLSQKPTVMIPPLTEGHQATLACTAPGLCSGSVPEITWTWRRAGVNDSHIIGNITDFKTENLTAVTQRHSSTLTFEPLAEHHGTEVTCKVRFTGNMTTEETVTLNVSYVKEVKITGKTNLKEGETLNLTCSVESFPPSFVMWTKLSEQNMQNRTEANLQKDTEPQKQTGMAALSISNVTADHSGQYICTAKHLNNTLKKQVTDVTVTYSLTGLLINIKWLQVIPAFLIGILLSATITCSARKCIRKNQSSVSLTENVEMVTTQAVQLDNADQATTHNGSNDQQAAEGDEAAWPSAPGEDNMNPKEVEYADIDVSKLKRRSPTEDKGTQEITKTEYAEIKKEKTMDQQENGRDESEMLVVYEEAVVMIGDDKDSEQVIQPEVEGEASLGRPSCRYNFCIRLIEGEITAEAGLCVVIPCSFITDPDFTPQYVVWFRCEPSKTRCTGTDMIFHSNKNNQNVQSEFRERVSLLEPEISQNNCSIIINDLKESDSGSYQLRVNGLLSGKQDGFTFTPRATVSVKGLSQKPTVMMPPLTEGHQATLTCTAPGLCSGSAPEITWTWRRAGVNDSHITGNITDFKTENLTAFTQRHSSALTFDPSAEHHGTEVTCKVRFTGNIITEETVTLNVSYVKEVKITGKTSVKEGETLNLTCSVESFPPSFVMWTKLSDQNMQNRTEANLQKDTEPQKQTGMAALSISNVTADHSGQYICTAKHLNNTLKKQVTDVTVTYVKEVKITGKTSVKEGETLNLTCSVESFPPSFVMWTKLSEQKLQNRTEANLQKDTEPQKQTGMAALSISNVTADHSGQYICTAKHLNNTLKKQVTDVTVTLCPKILNDSRCVKQLDVLTCVCISEGLPLPTIKWPLLENHTEYSVTTTVSNHTVNSSIRLSLMAQSKTSFECVSSNDNGQTKHNLSVKNVSQQDVKDHCLSQKPTVMIPPLTEGHQATLTCTAPGLCSGSVPEITWTWRRAGVNDSHITGNITDFKTENLTAVTQRHSSTLTFDPSAEHHGTEVTCKVRFTGNMMTEKTVTLNVSYVKEVKITGKTSVKEGETLNLTCSVESFPPSFVMWTKLSEQNMQNRTEANRKKDTEPQKQTGMAALSISNVTADHSGQYICTAKHLNNTLKKQVTDVTVTFGPKILNDSRCVNQLDVLTCVCISEGLPLPTIKWPLLENHTEYSVTTTVSNHTVNSSIRLSLMAQSKTTFECVSSNDNGQTKHNLSVKNVSQQDVKDHYSLTDLSTNIYWLQVIPAFLIGILLSATITCSARKCIRKKQSSVNLTENVEMVTTQAVPLVDADQAIVDDITRDQQAAEGAEAAWPLAPGEDNVNPKEVEYTDIDVSKLKRKSPTEDKGTQKTRDSEYAEIKKEKTMDRQNNVREESEMLVVYEEAAVVIGDKESEQVIQAEVEGGEDMALYSNVNEIMGRIYLNGVSEE